MAKSIGIMGNMSTISREVISIAFVLTRVEACRFASTEFSTVILFLCLFRSLDDHFANFTVVGCRPEMMSRNGGVLLVYLEQTVMSILGADTINCFCKFGSNNGLLLINLRT